MEYEHIRLEIREAVAFITLKREPLNVLNIAMMKEINQALDSLEKEAGLSVLVFQAEGKAFSAGVDVAEHLGDQAPSTPKRSPVWTSSTSSSGGA